MVTHARPGPVPTRNSKRFMPSAGGDSSLSSTPGSRHLQVVPWQRAPVSKALVSAAGSGGNSGFFAEALQPSSATRIRARMAASYYTLDNKARGFRVLLRGDMHALLLPAPIV